MVITYENEKRLTLFFFLEILQRVWNKRADFFSKQMQFTNQGV
jgi:hypothetical protein